MKGKEKMLKKSKIIFRKMKVNLENTNEIGNGKKKRGIKKKIQIVYGGRRRKKKEKEIVKIKI